MTKTLIKDICRLRDPEVLIKDIDQEQIDACVPLAFCYACVYWVHHFEQSHRLAALQNPINSFI
jgi:hypothetical protein